jgi:hypothetical protein
MRTDSLNSKTDGNGVRRTANPLANPNLTGPDVLPQGGVRQGGQRGMGNQRANIVPAVRVTKATQQALEYYNRVKDCNCGK